MKMNLIAFSLSWILIQKTNYLFQNHQRDRNHIFVQSSQSFIERKLLWKVVSDWCISHLSEQLVQSAIFDKQWFHCIHTDTRLIIKLSFDINLLTWLEYLISTFWLDLILILNQYSIQVLDLTHQEIKYDVKRVKYRNFSEFSPLHYLFALSFW